MKRITVLVFLIFPVISFAQIYFGSPIAASNDGSVTATAKNWEAIEINPANLGWSDNHTFSFSIANVALNFADNGVTLNQIENLNIGDSITPQQRQEIYNAVTAPGGLNVSATINWAAFSFTIPKVGGFAISLTDKLYAHAELSPNAARIMTDLIGVKDSVQLQQTINKDSNLLKETPAQILDGSNAGGYQYRELNIDFGRKLLTIETHSVAKGGASFENSEFFDTTKTSHVEDNPIVIYGGIGFKPIWGLGSFNSVISGGENTQEGSYVYGNTNYLQNIYSNILTANGRGYGVDLGLSATYKKWALGVSAIDLGQITWQNNSFQPFPAKFPPGDSLYDDFQNNAKILNYFIDHNASNTGGQPNYTTQLPSQFRTGISYKVGRLLTLSSDFVAPLNNVEGNLLSPYYAVGAHFDLFRIVGLGIGYATEKGFGNLLPMGIFINVFYGFEVYVGTNDAFAYISNSTGHVLSGEAGIKLLGF